MYAKLINNTLRRAPDKVQYNGNKVFNPPDNVLSEMGYLPVTYTDMPVDAPEGYHYEYGWIQSDTEIVRVWHLAENPAEPEPELTMSDLIAAVERGLTT